MGGGRREERGRRVGGRREGWGQEGGGQEGGWKKKFRRDIS